MRLASRNLHHEESQARAADFAMVPFDNSNEVKTKMKEFKWLKRKKVQ